MNKTNSTNFLHKKAACFTIPGEYCYEWNLITDTIKWMGKLYEKLGYKKNGFPKTLADWENNLIHPLDTAKVKRNRYQHLKTGDAYQESYRIRRNDGAYVLLLPKEKQRLTLREPYKWNGSVQLHPDKQTH